MIHYGLKRQILAACVLASGLTNTPGFCADEQITLSYLPTKAGGLEYVFSEDAWQKTNVFGDGGVSMAGKYTHQIAQSDKKITHQFIFVDLSAQFLDPHATRFNRPTEHMLNTAMLITSDRLGQNHQIQSPEALPVIQGINISTLLALHEALPELPVKPVAIGDSWEFEFEETISHPDNSVTTIHRVTTLTLDQLEKVSNVRRTAEYQSLRLTGTSETTHRNSHIKRGTFEGVMKANIVAHFAPELGAFVKYEVQDEGTMSNKKMDFTGTMGTKRKFLLLGPKPDQ